MKSSVEERKGYYYVVEEEKIREYITSRNPEVRRVVVHVEPPE